MNAAVFDMDGTLFDTEKLYREAWLKVAEPFGLEVKPKLGAAVSGTGGQITLDIIKTFYPDEDPRKISDWVGNYVETVSEKNLVVMEGVPEILEYFRAKNFKLAVASGTPADVVHRNLKNAGFEKYFSVVTGGDMIHDGGKPNPGIFLQTIEKLNEEPKNCYVFEDAFNGIRAAYSAGAYPVLVNPYDEFSKANDEIKTEIQSKAQKIFLSMKNALEWLQNN